MVDLYCKLIIAGLRTLDSIKEPVMKEKVKERLKEMGSLQG